MNIPLVITMAFWLVVALFIPIFAFLGVDDNFRLYYSNTIQTLSALIAAVLCYYVLSNYTKDNPVRRVWAFLGIALTCWLVGNIIYTAYPLLNNGEETPLIYYSDIGYLGFNLFLIIALFAFKNALDLDPPIWGKLLALAVFFIALSISYLGDQETIFQGGITSFVQILYIISEPIFVMMVVLVASGLIGGSAGGPWWFMVAGLFFYYVGSVFYTYLTIKGEYISGSPIDFLWVFGFYLVGAAAIKQHMLFIRSH